MQMTTSSTSEVVEKHYVEFLSPGTLFSENTTKPINSWDPVEAVRKAESIVERHGAKPFGFRFSTKLETTTPDGRGGEIKGSKTIKISGMYFLGGKLETYDQVLTRNNPEESILRSNMRNNDLWIVCVNTNSYRSVQPFEEDSFVVDAQGNIIASGNDPAHVAYRKAAASKYKDEY